MQLNIKFIVFLTLLFCSIFSVNAAQRTIQIGTIGFPPYGISQQGESSGIYYELANLIVANAGYNATNKIIPYARAIQSLKYGDIDITIMFRNPALEGYVDYVAALPSKKTIVIGSPEQSFKQISDLSGKRIAYLRGAKFNKQIDADATIEKHIVSSYRLGIKMIMAGRADAVIGPQQSIDQAVLDIEKGNNGAVQLGKPLLIEDKKPWVQISKKSSADLDIERLKQSFIELEKKDTFNTLKAKYSPANESSNE